MKRENLESKEFGLIIASRNFPFYAAPEADSVMDELEERIKELEAENKHLEDYIDAYQKSEAINIAKLDEKDKRIKELESIPHTDNTSVIDELQNRIRKLLQKTI